MNNLPKFILYKIQSCHGPTLDHDQLDHSDVINQDVILSIHNVKYAVTNKQKKKLFAEESLLK